MRASEEPSPKRLSLCFASLQCKQWGAHDCCRVPTQPRQDVTGLQRCHHEGPPWLFI